MRTTLDPVRPIELSEIREAGNRIAKTIVRTPLVRLELGSDQPDIRLKLENLQPINAYKLRGAANAVAMLPESERERGVWTISAGNAGQGVAYAAKQAGVPCSVVVMGLEILEDAPETTAVIASIGGGGLITGVASAIKALNPEVKIFGVEPENAAPAALSFEKGSPQVFKEWRPSFVDGAGGQSMFPRMWERMKPVVDDYLVVSLDETKRAMRLMAEKARVISEGAGALPLAAALTGKAGKGPIVAIVSGGNIDLNKFCELIRS
jgi:threonine dehydratase